LLLNALTKVYYVAENALNIQYKKSTTCSSNFVFEIVRVDLKVWAKESHLCP